MALSILLETEAPPTGDEFAARDEHPYWGEFGRRYYAAVFGDARRSESFIVMDGDTPLLLVPCTSGADMLDWFGLPLRLFPRLGLARDLAGAAVERAMAHFDSLAAERGVRQIVLADASSLGILSPLGEACIHRGAAAAVRVNGICDLTGGEPAMRRGLRKSFKSLLNWGRRNLDIQIIGKVNPDGALFAQYQDFHRKVAGRATRAQESWDIMFRWIAAGRGELILGFLGTELVTGTLAVDGKGVAAYASGVYDRAHFDKPLAHWPLWLVMLRSAERSIHSFDLGELPLSREANEKEYAIGFFKRGFATALTAWIAWTVSPAAMKSGVTG